MTERSTENESSATRYAYGVGLATVTDHGKTLEVWYPAPALESAEAPNSGSADSSTEELAELAHNSSDVDRGVQSTVVHTRIDLDAAPASTEDAYLRLHLLSHRLAAPNTINLDGIFAQLPNVVWTNFGPCEVENFEITRAKLRKRGIVTVLSLDKFPRMVDYVLPVGVRIADANRVRLGAHLAEGTTVMHEGFVNFNAGTVGVSMVEGRISAGVVVGNGSDVGGGASIMGTLSGGGTETVKIGERVLLGANSGVGISIGDDSIVEAGLYVTAGTKVRMKSGKNEDGDDLEKIVKALELSGVPNLVFRRNSSTGEVEALSRVSKSVELNEALHAN